ncbi:MAG: heavy metal sensor histidine kinase [Rhodoferax sp.]|uniref:heavy metal sensor histidine kinase n=1 Tax=Rhodoferax sp. TaxID=50421 RepID=UPI00262A8D4F|nr:heavy metal sensor histidine kinase [Rhodoferax sp.]MDD2878955.1 heavy metal sensor histidine kinase [Rhodoferax sp.]
MRVTGRTSIARRLTLLFVAASTAVLLALGFVVASSVEQHFEDLDMEVLVGKMDLIRQTLVTVKTPDALSHIGHQLEHSLVGHHGLEVLIIGADHTRLFATPNATFPVDQVVANAAPHSSNALRPMVWSFGPQNFRVVAAELPTGLPGKLISGQALEQQRDRYQLDTVWVAVATDMAHHQAYMHAFLQTLWLFVGGAAVLTGLLGWAVVRRGLAPLRAMQVQAQGVNAQQLNQRLPVETVPRELAELAQSLNDMLARLQDAFQRLSDFSSDIAHELRTPVSNLLTQTQVTLTRERSAQTYRDILESNAEEFERMARMISDMLLLAKADNGLVLPQREPLVMATEIRALFDYFEAIAEEKNITLSLEGDCKLSADRLMLRRAVANLLSNAVRHAHPSSTVSVSLQTLHTGVQISVSNVGDDIAPEHIDRVFDRFFRVDPARQRSFEGTGLGLAITQSIVTAHDGRIRATSANGLTTFTVSLPLSATDESHPPPPAV